MKYIVAVLLALALSACGTLSNLALESQHVRDRAADRITDEWCGLTSAEREALADRRGYAEDTVAWLDGRCET